MTPTDGVRVGIYSGHRLGLNSLRSATASPQRGDRHATVALIRDSHGPFIASPLTAKDSIVVGLSASAANSAVAFAIWAEKNYLSHQRKRCDQRGQPAHSCAGAVRASWPVPLGGGARLPTRS